MPWPFFDKEETPFLSLVNVMERLCLSCRFPYRLESPGQNPLIGSWQGLHPSERYDFFVMGKIQGIVFSVHPLILREFKIKGFLSMAVLDTTLLEKISLKKASSFKPLDKYPGSFFDWTVLLPKKESVRDQKVWMTAFL